jgi:hypothetical protein
MAHESPEHPELRIDAGAETIAMSLENYWLMWGAVPSKSV